MRLRGMNDFNSHLLPTSTDIDTVSPTRPRLGCLLWFQANPYTCAQIAPLPPSLRPSFIEPPPSLQTLPRSAGSSSMVNKPTQPELPFAPQPLLWDILHPVPTSHAPKRIPSIKVKTGLPRTQELGKTTLGCLLSTFCLPASCNPGRAATQF
ncbi:hypothetical protein Cadr_000018713 [Camelus dromedarius]|uniref:Uncharacterized protein n=1 Tax=Camelus dromedarius TaxID=9838 RepID=A0A5N4D588_CAMDR|nr:hypothetical protein Cadr_000018713 [Camelus dromedarius]